MRPGGLSDQRTILYPRNVLIPHEILLYGPVVCWLVKWITVLIAMDGKPSHYCIWN